MAIIEYFIVKVKDLKTTHYINTDFSILLKEHVDKLKPEEKYCENRTCSAILAEYVENNDPIESITFDFAKLTGETITSAIKHNLIENVDTFKELDEKTLALVEYTNEEYLNVRKIIETEENISNMIEKLELLNLNFYKIYKIIEDKGLNIFIKRKNLKTEFYNKHLQRFKKDKTFFNTFRVNNTNIMQCQKNSEGFDFKKIEQYINEHLLHKEDKYIVLEKIYDSEFLDMLKHQDLRLFEIQYHSESKKNLLSDNADSFLFQLSDSFGRNKTKVSAIADENSTLNNEKIIAFFEAVNSLGILDECNVSVKGSQRKIKSTSNGSILHYSIKSKMQVLSTANLIFLEAYENRIDTIKQRLL